MFKRTIIALIALFAFGGVSSSVFAHGKGETYKVVLQVNEADPAKMNMVLNNAMNVNSHFKAAGRKVDIEIVAYGPGLNMLRDDKSPVKMRIQGIADDQKNIKFAACGNTIKKVTKKQGGKKPPLMKTGNITVVPSGVIQIIDRQDEGWHYIRP